MRGLLRGERLMNGEAAHSHHIFTAKPFVQTFKQRTVSRGGDSFINTHTTVQMETQHHQTESTPVSNGEDNQTTQETLWLLVKHLFVQVDGNIIQRLDKGMRRLYVSCNSIITILVNLVLSTVRFTSRMWNHWHHNLFMTQYFF